MKVVFDVGNVLAYASLYWKDALVSSGLKEASVVPPFEKLYDLPTYLPYESGRISEAEYLSSLVENFGLRNHEDALLLHRSIVQNEVPGVLEFVRFLHSNGIQTATLSNNNPIHWEWFTKTGPFPAIQEINFPVASFELGYHKPEAEIYHALCSKLGWKSSEIILFDDIEPNVHAARKEGWNAVLINPKLNIPDQLKAGLELHFKAS